MRFVIKNLIESNSKIMNIITPSSIFSYRVPTETQMQKDIVIYIDFLDVPTPYTFFDGEYHHEEYLMQIEVFAPSKRYNEFQKVNGYLQDLIEQELDWKLQGGVDQYDDELKVYRMAKRYRGIYKILRERL